MHRKDAIRQFKIEKKSFKYNSRSSTNTPGAIRDSKPGKGGIPMKRQTRDFVIREGGYYIDSQSGRAIERLDSISKLNVISAVGYGKELKGRLEQKL